jgi:DNA-binding transcriptional regulator GbsR (MarR family)
VNPENEKSWIYVNNVLDDYGLDPYEFRIYAHVARRTGGRTQGEFFASLKKTAEICKMSVRKVQYALKVLCDAGFLVQLQQRKGRTNKYQLAPRSSWVTASNLAEIRKKSLSSAKREIADALAKPSTK